MNEGEMMYLVGVIAAVGVVMGTMLFMTFYSPGSAGSDE